MNDCKTIHTFTWLREDYSVINAAYNRLFQLGQKIKEAIHIRKNCNQEGFPNLYVVFTPMDSYSVKCFIMHRCHPSLTPHAQVSPIVNTHHTPLSPSPLHTTFSPVLVSVTEDLRGRKVWIICCMLRLLLNNPLSIMYNVANSLYSLISLKTIIKGVQKNNEEEEKAKEKKKVEWSPAWSVMSITVTNSPTPGVVEADTEQM